MAVESGVVIRGGRFQGEIIGISDNIVTTAAGYVKAWGYSNDSRGQQVDGTSYWWNDDFDLMIMVPDIFELSGPDFTDECIADIAIIDDNQISGYFSLYATRSGLTVSVTGKMKNSSGVVVFTFNQGGNAQITIDGRSTPAAFLGFSKTTIDDHDIYGLYFVTSQTWSWAGMPFALGCYAGAWVDDETMYQYFGIPGHIDSKIKKKSKDPNIKTDPNGTTDDIPKGDKKRGGQGTHDYSTHIIPMPVLPTFTATKTGFVTLYRVSEAILRTLADKLFSDTWAGALDNFFQNADEVIAGLSIVPFQPPVSGRAKPRVGLNVLDVSMDVISSQYVEVDCGELDVEEFYGSSFDYAPYTKISIYLPYVGVRSLDVDEVMAHRIGVKYYCDAYSGCCMACIYVYVDPQTGEAGDQPTLKYTFSGNIAQQVPTASQSWDRMIQSGIALACVALPAIAAGGAAIQSAGYGAQASMAAMQGSSAMGAGFATRSVLTHAAAGASESWVASGSAQMALALDGATMATAMSAKPTVERTGSLGSGVGFLGPQKPFLILEIPRQSIPFDYMEFHGYPSNESATLGELEGYVQVEDIHLTEVYATGPEKDEIMKMLKEGVIL